MGEPAVEMSVSRAREHFADVINSDVYAGRITMITRRGKPIAAVAPLNWLTVVRAEAREAAAAEVCRAWWTSVAGADQPTQDAVRATIDRIMEAAKGTTAEAVPSGSG